MSGAALYGGGSVERKMRFAEAIALSIVWVSSPPVHDASQKRWRPGTVESEYSGQERGGERKARRSGVGQVGEDGSARRQADGSG